MFRQVELVAALAATVTIGCAPQPAGPDAHEAVEAALSGAARARACAFELAQAVDEDASAAAAALHVEPAALAPWGGAERGKEALRGIILARAAAAQDAARAARSLSLLGELASPQQHALRRARIAESLGVSSALCEASAGVRGGLLAQRRVTSDPP